MIDDNYKLRGLRNKLVKKLREKGIHDEAVLAAIGKVPRHVFFENALIDHAYQDKAFPIGEGQTISQPYTVAFQSEKLEIRPGDKVLEIGTGSGYQTCILLELGAKVYTIERQKELFDTVQKKLPLMGYVPKMFYGDGYKGLPAYAPFDKILVTCGAPIIPEELVKQLKVGGRMVIPIGAGEFQVMTLILKTSESEIEKHELQQF